MDRPKFLDYSEADLGSWRALAPTRDFVEWLLWEHQNGLMHLRGVVAGGDPHKSAIVAGMLEFNDQVIGAILTPRPEPQKEPEEEEVQDPATPPSVLRKRKRK